jgi:hypothetical protein
MELDSLSKLSAEQLAGINDEQKVIFCAMSSADQDFFAKTYKPKDLPTVLTRKGEIIKRNQTIREQMENIQKKLAETAIAVPEGNSKVEDVLTAAAGAVGIGAVAAAVASDNTAFWRGVKPEDLIAPLRTEFNNDNTQVKFDGNPNALTSTIALLTDSGSVPALTVNLSAVRDGTEVKLSDLTSQGTIETLKEGGQKLLSIAGSALKVLNRSKNFGSSPEDLLSSASNTLSQGADLAEVAGNLKIKDRAWKVLRQTADTIEKNYLSELEKARQARFALEKAWNDYYNCATCGVAFDTNDTICRLCGSGRPEKPMNPDPRQQ